MFLQLVEGFVTLMPFTSSQSVFFSSEHWTEGSVLNSDPCRIAAASILTGMNHHKRQQIWTQTPGSITDRIINSCYMLNIIWSKIKCKHESGSIKNWNIPNMNVLIRPAKIKPDLRHQRETSSSNHNDVRLQNQNQRYINHLVILRF